MVYVLPSCRSSVFPYKPQGKWCTFSFLPQQRFSYEMQGK